MHLLDPLPLLLVFARLITSELEMEMHAPFALVVEPLLSKRQSQLLPLRTLTVLARQTSMEMVPHALIALLALMHLLDPLSLLLAFARKISSELETEMHAVSAPTVVSLPSKRQSQLLPLRTLTVLARMTHMDPTLTLDALPAPMQVPSRPKWVLLRLTANVVLAPILVLKHALSALLVLPHLLDLLLLLLASALLTTMEPALNALPVRQVVPVPRAPHQKTTVNALPTPTRMR
jgi:hypothetical protein